MEVGRAALRPQFKHSIVLRRHRLHGAIIIYSTRSSRSRGSLFLS